MKSKVSIIVPIFNIEEYLEDCIKSIINQTYKNLEIILINDGSTDCSLKICKKFKKLDKRIVLIDKDNTGVSNTRNIGINSATGDYITFVDSDDWLELDAIENMVKLAYTQNCDIIRTNFTLVNEDGKIPRKLLGKHQKKNLRMIKEYLLNAKLPSYTWLLLIKTDILRKNNLFFDEELYMMEDTHLVVRILDFIDSLYISKFKTYNYRLNSQSISNSNKRYMKNIKNILKVNEKIVDLLQNDNKLIEITNHSEFKIINDFFEKIIYQKNNDDINNAFNILCNNKRFKYILNNTNYKKLRYRDKVFYNAYTKVDYFKINKYYKNIEYLKPIKKICDIISFKYKRIRDKYILHKHVD